MLILKQRTGLATIIAMIVSAFMYAIGASPEEIGMVLSPIFVYVGKQSYLDSKEMSSGVTKQFEQLKDQVETTVEFLSEDFVEKPE